MTAVSHSPALKAPPGLSPLNDPATVVKEGERAPGREETVRHDYIYKFLFGGLACMASSAMTNPADIIKVRQQLAITASGGQVLPQNVWKTGYTMVLDEGALSLFKGVSASMCREASYSTIRYGTYEPVKELLGGGPGFGVKLAAGLIAGMLGSAIASPTDLVKVRMQAFHPGSKPRYSSVAACFREVWRQGRWRGLYRGVLPTTFRAAVLTSSQAKNRLLSLPRDSVWSTVLPTTEGCLVCSLTSAPVDVIKVRIMNDHDHVYRNALDCLVKTVRMEGPLALYKGFASCWLRLGSHTVISLVLFEALLQSVGLNFAQSKG